MRAGFLNKLVLLVCGPELRVNTVTLGRGFNALLLVLILREFMRGGDCGAPIRCKLGGPAFLIIFGLGSCGRSITLELLARGIVLLTTVLA